MKKLKGPAIFRLSSPWVGEVLYLNSCLSGFILELALIRSLMALRIGYLFSTTRFYRGFLLEVGISGKYRLRSFLRRANAVAHDDAPEADFVRDACIMHAPQAELHLPEYCPGGRRATRRACRRGSPGWRGTSARRRPRRPSCWRSGSHSSGLSRNPGCCCDSSPHTSMSGLNEKYFVLSGNFRLKVISSIP